MKRNCWYTAFGLLIFFLLCLVPSGQAQSCVPVSQGSTPPWQLGTKCVFTSASGSVPLGNVAGLNYFQIFFVPTGTVSGASLSLDSSATGASYSTGGIITAASIGAMTSAGSYSNNNAITPTAFGQLTPSITGSGNVTVTVFGYVNPPPATSAAGPATNVSVNNFPSTQPVSAVSLPLPSGAATAANQAAPGTAGSPSSQVSSVQGVSGGTAMPVSLATAPTTPTQPAGFAALVSAQQAVTASAVALPSNSVHGFCVQALSTNALTVYVGPSGVTTSTGFPLAPGQGVCFQLSNINLVYVIASGTGSSVALTGN
jgi:hypothetical protein